MAKVVGNGTIEKRGEKRWRLKVCVEIKTGLDSNEHRRLSKNIRGNKADAKRALVQWVGELENGIKLDADTVTFREYALTWHQSRVDTQAVRVSTLDRDARMIAYLISYIGDVCMTDIEPTMLKVIYSQMRKDGASADKVHRAHVKLKHILHGAVDEDFILRNPCDRVRVPKPKSTEKRNSLNEGEAARLVSILDNAGDVRAENIGVRIGLATGMRLGEVLGLTWAHVDLEGGSIEVVQQYTEFGKSAPKTDAGNRTIAIGPKTVEHLSEWKEQQKKQLRELALKQKLTVPVVINEAGGYYNQGDFRRWFQRFCVENGYGRWTTEDGKNVKPTQYKADGTRVDGNGKDADGKPYSRVNKKPKKHYTGLKFHELRHTQATLMIAEGKDIKTVQHRLGHSKASTTLDMYAHAMPGNDREAADDFEALLDNARPIMKVANL